MNCKKARELMVLDLYSEAGAPDKARLEEHLRGCASAPPRRRKRAACSPCSTNTSPRKRRPPTGRRPGGASSRGSGKNPPRAASPRRASLFRPALALGVRRDGPDPRPRRRNLHRKVRLRALAPDGRRRRAGVRKLRPSAASRRRAPPCRPCPPRTGIRPVFASHLDDLKPILLDYAHYVPGEKAEGRVVVDKAALRTLMLQNVLLKRKLAEKDPRPPTSWMTSTSS